MIHTHTCRKRRRRARKARKKRTKKKREKKRKVEGTRSTVKDLEVSLLGKKLKPLLDVVRSQISDLQSEKTYEAAKG